MRAEDDGHRTESREALGAQRAAFGAVLRSSLGVASSALLGFVVGAVFWHFVGFWSFVRDVLYQGPVTERQVALQHGRACTELVLDRVTGKMTPAACPDDAQALLEAPPGTRSDRIGAGKKASSTRWSVTVQAERDEFSTGSD